MSIQIIIDSTADFTPQEAAKLGLLRASLTLHWDGVEYRDGEDITPPEFFARLSTSEKLPTTSQVPVPVFEELFRQVLADGDEAIAILLSHNLSGTLQSATIAREGLESGREKIHLVDAGTASMGSMMLIQETMRLREQAGATAAAIAEAIREIAGRLRVLAAVETLKFLHKGGRLSAGATFMGTLLSVKPVLAVQDGLISVAQKVRGNTAAYQWIAQHLKEVGWDPAYPPIIGSTQCPQLVRQFTDIFSEKTGHTCDRFCDIGTVIGTHSGPGAVAIAYVLPNTNLA